jgi:hypothetical protein
VTVDFKEIPMPENRLQLQQAQRMTFEDGLSSPSRELAREANISQEEARRQIGENLDEYRQIRQVMAAEPVDRVGVVSFDLDGTLTDSANAARPEVIEMLRAESAAGTVVIVTARQESRREETQAALESLGIFSLISDLYMSNGQKKGPFLKSRGVSVRKHYDNNPDQLRSFGPDVEKVLI